ncbi:MAG: serine hydrolase domain-containing protein [Acidobacteriota bacterium]
MPKDGRLESILNEAIQRRVFPGAVFAVGRSDRVEHVGAVGRLRYDSDTQAEPATLYDLASLTKVVATTAAIMLLVEGGRLTLDAPAQSELPEFPLKSVTIRQLLAHASGWPAYEQFFLHSRSRAELLAALWATPAETAPGEKSVYSDLGFIALGVLVERAGGLSLDRFVRDRILRPLGMRDTRFNPPASLRDQIAPTEDDPWRGRVVHGEVHDENAFVLGGVAGHAGLFGAVTDLARFAQVLLQGGGTLFRRATIEEFTRRIDFTSQPSSRALGWDTPAAGSSSGSKVSRRAYGHTGYAGTSMWIDPERDLFSILLTNRVHPTRNGPDITPVRIAFHEGAVDG